MKSQSVLKIATSLFVAITLLSVTTNQRNNQGGLSQPPEVRLQLPAYFVNAKIVRFSTKHAFLEIVGYNSARQLSCAYGLFWSTNSSFFTEFNLTRTECSRLRCTRTSTASPKIVSYVSDSGIFNWFYITTPNPTFEGFQQINENLFQAGVLRTNNNYEVMMTKGVKNSRGSSKDRSTNFIIYQRSADNAGNYPQHNAVLSSPLPLTPTGKLTLNLDSFKWKSLQGKTSGGKIQWVNFVKSYEDLGNYNEFSYLWVGVKGPKGTVKTTFYNSDFETPGKEFLRFFDLPKLTSNSYATLTFTGNQRLFFVEYFAAARTINVCTTKKTKFKLKRISDFERSCLQDQISLNLTANEYIDEIQIRKDKVLVVVIRESGFLDKVRVVLYTKLARGVVPIQHAGFLYAANPGYVFQVDTVLTSGAVEVLALPINSLACGDSKKRLFVK